MLIKIEIKAKIIYFFNSEREPEVGGTWYLNVSN